MIDVDMKAHRSRIHSYTDDSEMTDEEHRGSVMQPLIVQPLKDFKLTEGQDATFFCKVAGVPKPRVRYLYIYKTVFVCVCLSHLALAEGGEETLFNF